MRSEYVSLSWFLFILGYLIFAWWVVAGACQKRIRLQQASRIVLKRDAVVQQARFGPKDEFLQAVFALDSAIKEYKAAHEQVVQPEPHYRILGDLQGCLTLFDQDIGTRADAYKGAIDELHDWLRRQIPLWWIPLA